ncbi:DUF1761 domain-containing protein [Propioniciclava soli]|uniref:DUF1761 domain-containing protein n=1 Tax=Propioniciclava soli TaxID=2775081 RepID=A0ABZ3CAG4_9ACTN
MNIPEINYWAVLAAVIASMVVGFVFYHPKVMGNRWMAAVGHTDASVSAGPKPWVYPSIMVASFVTAWVLAGAAWLAQEFYGGSFLVNALVTALILWVGLTASRFFVHDVFEPRGLRVTPYTLLNEFVTIMAMALAIGLLPPG